MKLPSFLQKRTVKVRTDVPDDQLKVPKAPVVDFQQLVQDFKTLDPKDPGLWPAAPRAVVLVGLFSALIGCAWWFGWNVQIEELDQKIAEEQALRNDWLDKKQQAVNLDAYRQQLADIGNSFGSLLEQLPNQAEMGDLLVDINKAAQSRGLVVELFRPGPEVRSDFYAEKPITMKVTGSYHDIASFAGDVAQLPRIVTLNDIDVTTDAAGKNLVLDTKAKTFRYLDEEELATQRKAGKKK
jgi:type IV pilus assembly protein PilO